MPPGAVPRLRPGIAPRHPARRGATRARPGGPAPPPGGDRAGHGGPRSLRLATRGLEGGECSCTPPRFARRRLASARACGAQPSRGRPRWLMPGPGRDTGPARLGAHPPPPGAVAVDKDFLEVPAQRFDGLDFIPTGGDLRPRFPSSARSRSVSTLAVASSSPRGSTRSACSCKAPVWSRSRSRSDRSDSRSARSDSASAPSRSRPGARPPPPGADRGGPGGPRSPPPSIR